MAMKSCSVSSQAMLLLMGGLEKPETRLISQTSIAGLISGFVGSRYAFHLSSDIDQEGYESAYVSGPHHSYLWQLSRSHLAQSTNEFTRPIPSALIPTNLFLSLSIKT